LEVLSVLRRQAMQIRFDWHGIRKCWLHESDKEAIAVYPITIKDSPHRYWLWVEEKENTKVVGVGHRCDSMWDVQKYLEPNQMVFRDPQEVIC